MVILSIILVVFLLSMFAESGNWISAGMATSVFAILVSSVMLVFNLSK